MRLISVPGWNGGAPGGAAISPPGGNSRRAGHGPASARKTRVTGNFGRGIELELLDAIAQGLLGEAQQLGGPCPVPARVGEGALDEGALDRLEVDSSPVELDLDAAVGRDGHRRARLHAQAEVLRLERTR